MLGIVRIILCSTCINVYLNIILTSANAVLQLYVLQCEVCGEDYLFVELVLHNKLEFEVFMQKWGPPKMICQPLQQVFSFNWKHDVFSNGTYGI